MDSGRLVLPVRWLISGRFPEMKKAGAFGTFQGKLFQVEGHAHWPEMDTTFVYFSDDEGKTWKASKTEVVIWHKDGFGGMWPCDERGIAQSLFQNLGRTVFPGRPPGRDGLGSPSYETLGTDSILD